MITCLVRVLQLIFPPFNVGNLLQFLHLFELFRLDVRFQACRTISVWCRTWTWFTFFQGAKTLSESPFPILSKRISLANKPVRISLVFFGVFSPEKKWVWKSFLAEVFRIRYLFLFVFFWALVLGLSRWLATSHVCDHLDDHLDRATNAVAQKFAAKKGIKAPEIQPEWSLVGPKVSLVIVAVRQPCVSTK